MDRLTQRIDDHYIARTERLNGKIIGNQMCLDKLGELEDAEEQGLLLRLPCEQVWTIVNQGTKYAIVIQRPIEFLTLFEIKGIDIANHYWSSKEKAEVALKRMEAEE